MIDDITSKMDIQTHVASVRTVKKTGELFASVCHLYV